MLETANNLLDKIPPQDLSAEKALIGAFLQDSNTAVERLEGFSLREDEFYLETHQILYRAIIETLRDKKTSDLLIVADWLKRHDLLERTGGTLYMSEAALHCSTAYGARHYAEIVRDHASRRNIIREADKLISLSYDGATDISEVLSDHDAVMDAIKQGNQTALRKLRQLWEWETDEFIRMEDEHGQGELKGVCSGIPGFDTLLDPMLPGDLHLVVGRPSMGKSLLAQAIACNNAYNGKHVLMLSLEMSEDSMARRIMAAEIMDIQGWELKKYVHRKAEWEKRMALQLAQMIEAHHDWDFALERPNSLTPKNVRDLGRQKQREGGLDLIVIDYLGLMDSERRTDKGDRYAEMGYISRQLKLIAGELKVPLVVLCQLNRECEKRSDKRPMLSDLRDSGNLEQDADIVTAVFREGYYNNKVHPTTGELILLKQRNGRVGVRPVYIDLERSRVCGIAEEGGQ